MKVKLEDCGIVASKNLFKVIYLVVPCLPDILWYELMDAQYFLIGTDGRQYGPLSQDDVFTWLTDGRASRYSRARRETEAQWAALRDMPEFEAATRPPHMGGAAVANYVSVLERIK